MTYSVKILSALFQQHTCSSENKWHIQPSSWAFYHMQIFIWRRTIGRQLQDCTIHAIALQLSETLPWTRTWAILGQKDQGLPFGDSWKSRKDMACCGVGTKHLPATWTSDHRSLTFRALSSQNSCHVSPQIRLYFKHQRSIQQWPIGIANLYLPKKTTVYTFDQAESSKLNPASEDDLKLYT